MYKFKLSFTLTKIQKETSAAIFNSYQQEKNILIDAVCGAGKTEMLLETIEHALNCGKKIGFACPRKQLTIELYERISGYFEYDGVGLVVGKISKNINSNIVFLTTHQLYKYNNYFDLLIIDEIDAFPFYDNYDLEQKALMASKQFIYLSATVPTKYYNMVENKDLVYIHNQLRHHQQKMPIPIKRYVRLGTCFINLVQLCRKHSENPLIVFVATIRQGQQLTKYLNILKLKASFVCGKTITSDKLEEFKGGKIKILVSTTVLERGITLKKLNVIVYDCANSIFKCDRLLQICGRVGRDSVHHDGYIYFMMEKETIEIAKTIEKLVNYNEMP